MNDQRPSEPNQETAMQFIEAGNYAFALRLLRAQVRDNPTDVNAMMSLAFCLERIGEVEEAKEVLQKIFELRPHFEPAETMIAQLTAGESIQKPRAFLSKEFFEPILPTTTSRKGFKWTTCPQCNSKMLAGKLRCVHCGYRFWYAIFLHCVIGCLAITAMLYALSYAIPPQLLAEFVYNRIPKMTWTQAAIFVYAWAISAAAMTIGCLLLNWTDTNKHWNEEWPYDVTAAILVTPVLVVTNAFVVAAYQTIKSEAALQGFLPIFTFSIFFIVAFQITIIYLAFGRSVLQTLGLCFLYICFNGLLRGILFTPFFG